MPVFEYRGLTPAGKQVKGLLEADSSRSLRQQLKRSGVFLTDVLGERESTTPARGKNGTAAAAAKPSLASREVQLGKLVRGRVTLGSSRSRSRKWSRRRKSLFTITLSLIHISEPTRRS